MEKSILLHASAGKARFSDRESRAARPISAPCRVLLAPVVAAVLLVGATAASADENPAGSSWADTSSPRATLKTFIDATNELYNLIRSEHYFDRTSEEHRPLANRILDCLDVRDLPEYQRIDAAGEVAACLKEILDRVELPPYEEIPDIRAIDAAGGPEKLPYWRIPGTRITIARVEEGPRRHEYLFSRGTVGRAVEYYHEMKSRPYRTTGPAVSKGLYRWYVSSPGHPAVAAVVDQLPDWFRSEWYGQAVWKWIGLFFGLVFAVFLMGLIYTLYARLTRRFFGKAPIRYYATILLAIAAVLVPLGFGQFARIWLTLRGSMLYAVNFATDAVAIVALLVVVFGASKRVAELIITSPHINPQGLNAQLIRIGSRLLSLLIAVGIFLYGGQYLGFPLSTLLASAGIGGLAIALAAQDTLKTLFGTIVLLSDKPFRVGDRIVTGGYDGVVEDIGLRSTKIRLLTGHQVTIPNDELARTDIENVGRRPYIRRIADVHLPLDTPREKVEQAVAAIRALLDDHEGMDPQFPPRVFFFDFGSGAFVIRIIYWYHPPKYWDFLAMSENLNFQLMQAFEELGIQFSLPMRITHTSIDSRPEPIEVRVLSGGDRSSPESDPPS